MTAVALIAVGSLAFFAGFFAGCYASAAAIRAGKVSGVKVVKE